MRRRTFALAAALAMTALIPPAGALAQGSTEWKFQAMLYGYFPTIAGKTTFPQRGASSSASVDIDTILDNLEFAFMGSLEAQKGRWGALTDLLYVNVGTSKSESRAIAIGGVIPAGAMAALDYDLEGGIWTLAGTYRAIATPAYTLDVLAGARMLDIEQKISWQFSGNVGPIPFADRSGSRNAGIRNWDAILGVKGRFAFGDDRRWFIPYYLDVGAGESRLTWQATGGLGYSFGWGDVIGAWRYVDYEMKSGQPIQAIDFSGPGIAVAFRW